MIVKTHIPECCYSVKGTHALYQFCMFALAARDKIEYSFIITSHPFNTHSLNC